MSTPCKTPADSLSPEPWALRKKAAAAEGPGGYDDARRPWPPRDRTSLPQESPSTLSDYHGFERLLLSSLTIIEHVHYLLPVNSLYHLTRDLRSLSGNPHLGKEMATTLYRLALPQFP